LSTSSGWRRRVESEPESVPARRGSSEEDICECGEVVGWWRRGEGRVTSAWVDIGTQEEGK